MKNLRAETIQRQLREYVKKFCSIADTCPHIGRNECAECAQISLRLKEHKPEE